MSRSVPCVIVILAGGRGLRMGTRRPKVLLPVAGLSMIERVLRASDDLEAARRVTILGYSADIIASTLMARQLDVATLEPLLGPVHALTALDLADEPDRSVVVLPADVPLLRRETLRALLAHRVTSSAALTMVTAVSERPYGLMRVLRSDTGEVMGLVGEKDASRQQRSIKECTSGVFACSAQALRAALATFSWDNVERERTLGELVSALRRAGHEVDTISATVPHEIRGINSQTELAEASAIMRQAKCEELMSAGVTIIDPATTYVGPDVEVGHDTVLHPNVYLEGRTRVGTACEIHAGSRLVDATLEDHVVILNYCVVTDSVVRSRAQLGPFAHIRPGSDVGEDARVGNYVELKKTTLGRASKASHLTYLGDATIGADVNVGAGVITCNYDGVNKHPTVIGDGAFIGSDSQLVAPVTVGRGAFVAAGSSITRDVPEESLGIARSRQENKDGWAKRRNRG
ncbi:bifunctional protein GlmU [Luteitalea sp. TBR-22]|uniref:bifunctional UDP-N-acetylglucosamine diphosphorylase/glucosamine-1-phosphate N-acetyltransferase GlmU n=1 Tax=Luteitalea sp. TBR-22 TaxID=2802971 RepID=UPI001AF97C10|nr:bifunctional UDP-N-acetylglucosamine diphosphorylase/glucosamine-1-phosphate N-acetyltransferase GlmU [Luteitalea sp. TBR-22]BCS30808.1 bifunctional protein GlmU [Luteitalea sp. TBR-22]